MSTHFIGDTVDTLDLSAFHARYDKDGPRNQPFHPVMMVKVLVYGYATGVFSSRKIARKLHEDVAFRVLADGFAWSGQTYDSLSKVAFAITGTKWNGPRFFGLRDKEDRSAMEARP